MIVRARRGDELRHGAAAAALPSPALTEESWPSKPIRIICGYPAGVANHWTFAFDSGCGINCRPEQPQVAEARSARQPKGPLVHGPRRLCRVAYAILCR